MSAIFVGKSWAGKAFAGAAFRGDVVAVAGKVWGGAAFGKAFDGAAWEGESAATPRRRHRGGIWYGAFTKPKPEIKKPKAVDSDLELVAAALLELEDF